MSDSAETVRSAIDAHSGKPTYQNVIGALRFRIARDPGRERVLIGYT